MQDRGHEKLQSLRTGMLRRLQRRERRRQEFLEAPRSWMGDRQYRLPHCWHGD
jgi:hypothetical protein